MRPELVEHIKSNPKFQELTKKRGSFAWKLAIAMLIIYYTFIMIIAFVPELFATPIAQTTTLGIPVGIVVIVLAFVLTGIYVKRANTEFDELSNSIKQDVQAFESTKE